MTGFHSQSASHDNTSAQRDDLHELTINLDTDIRTGAIKNSWDAASYREVLHYKQAPLLQKLLDLHQFTGSETVLDLGCGEGYLGSSAVVPRVPNGRYIGADISPEMLALADPLFAEIPNATVTHGDLLNLEDLFQRENLRKKVDVVVSNEALHWIADREQHKRI
ncbi:MAG: class I SAM-dependent methyltransferase, partial [Bdellovibrionales bacterium]|nr:class I SAM-dependent methyltransferase [Bdellovibrionales bacterium]